MVAMTEPIVRRQSQYYLQKLVRSDSTPDTEAVTPGRFGVSIASSEVFTSENVCDQKMQAWILV